MGKDVIIRGETYNGVGKVNLLTANGSANFYDVSGALCTITAEYDEYDEVYTSDKTAQEVYDALEVGINPVFRFHNLLDDDAYIYASLTKLESTEDGEELTLSSFQTDAMIADTLSDYFTLTVHGEAPAVQKTVSGSLITITDALAEPAVALSTAINPVQSGSGDPSPSNVRPISGWTGANVTRTGLNLWGGDVLAEAFRGCTGYAKDTTAKTITFNRAPSSPYHMTLCAVPFKPLTQYTLLAQYSNGGQNTSMMVEYTDGTSAQISFNNSSNAKTSRAFVTASGKTVKEFFLDYKATSKTTIYYEESGVFEGVLTYNDFESYNGTTFPFDWTSTAGTVYGGTLDVVNGTLTARPYYASYNGETLVGPWVSSMDVYAENTTPTTGAQVVDLGGTATTYTLTPTEVQMLLGTNNVWSDTGDTTLTYKADGRVNSLTALNMLLGNMYTPSADVTDREALQIIMGESE